VTCAIGPLHKIFIFSMFWFEILITHTMLIQSINYDRCTCEPSFSKLFLNWDVINILFIYIYIVLSRSLKNDIVLFLDLELDDRYNCHIKGYLNTIFLVLFFCRFII